MGFDLINDHFDLPSLVIAVDEVESRGGAWIEPGGGQAIDLLWFPQAGIGDAIFDHAHQQGLDPLLSLLFARHIGRQIAARASLAQVGRQMMAGQWPHHMSPARADCLPETEPGELGVMQEEHVGLKARAGFPRLDAARLLCCR